MLRAIPAILSVAIAIFALADCIQTEDDKVRGLPASDLANLIQELTDQMHQAAHDLHFELAARLRDEISELKKELRQMSAATG